MAAEKVERKVLWGEMTAEELRRAAALDALVLVPVASLEQHGPHLPTATDTMLGSEVAMRAALLADQPVVVTPPVWTGLSEHHMPFGGTVTLAFEAFRAILYGIATSVERHGFARIFFLNAHGGNVTALRVIVDEMARDLKIRAACATYWVLGADELAPMLETQKTIRHACEAETSMIMAMRPDLVREDRLKEADCPDPVGLLPGAEEPYRWKSFAEKTHSGAIGNPSAASREKGARLLETAARRVAAAITSADLWAVDGCAVRPDRPE